MEHLGKICMYYYRNVADNNEICASRLLLQILLNFSFDLLWLGVPKADFQLQKTLLAD